MSDINIRKKGHAGRITLTRPDALNALTYEMCMAIGEALENWRDDESVKLVIIDAEGSKSFCAGGDIADLYSRGKAGDYDYGRTFWADEYRVNAVIENYPKPYVAIMDGIVMGGGVGISAHGSHRIVTENTMFAMPECGIGLVPDVGGNWLLSRAPGRIGEYLGTTGARLGAADCMYASLADVYVEEDKLDALIQALETSGNVDDIQTFASAPAQGQLIEEQGLIDQHFALDDALAIVKSLEAETSDWALKAAKLMRRNSPLAVAVAVELVRRARDLQTIEDVLKLEYRFTWRSLDQSDFLEGIRAQIVDKDRNPQWQPSRFEELNKTRIHEMLEVLGEHELNFAN